MSKEEIIGQIVIPENVSATISDNHIIIKGPKGELGKKFLHENINVETSDNKIIFFSKKKITSKEKMIFGTFRAHIKNMINGVTGGFYYKLRICSGHFPMTVNIKDNYFEIKNFLGERIPRVARLESGVEAKISGDIIELYGLDIERVGQTAANLEQATRISGRDRRVFQDRINIIMKAGKII